MERRTALRPWAVAAWLVLWQTASMAFGQPLLLPSPLLALRRLAALIPTASFWTAVGRSCVRILGGAALGGLLGTALAVPSGADARIRDLIGPAVTAVKAVPVASFTILALVWLDARSLAVFISALMAFPPAYLGVLEGIGQADRDLLEMARVFRVPLIRQIRGIYLPRILPSLRTALSLSLGLCWKAGVAAEVIGIPGGSLGERLYSSKVYLLTADLFAWTAVIVALSALSERICLWALDRIAERMGLS